MSYYKHQRSPTETLALLHRNLTQELVVQWKTEGLQTSAQRLACLGGEPWPLMEVSAAAVKRLRDAIDGLRHNGAVVVDAAPDRRLEFPETPRASPGSLETVLCFVSAALSERRVRRQSAIAFAQGSRAVQLWSAPLADTVRHEREQRTQIEMGTRQWFRRLELQSLREQLAMEEAAVEAIVEEEMEEQAVSAKIAEQQSEEQRRPLLGEHFSVSLSSRAGPKDAEGHEERLRLKFVSSEESSRRCIFLQRDEATFRQCVLDAAAQETLARATEWAEFRGTFTDARQLTRAFRVVYRAVELAEAEARAKLVLPG